MPSRLVGPSKNALVDWLVELRPNLPPNRCLCRECCLHYHFYWWERRHVRLQRPHSCRACLTSSQRIVEQKNKRPGKRYNNLESLGNFQQDTSLRVFKYSQRPGIRSPGNCTLGYRTRIFSGTNIVNQQTLSPVLAMIEVTKTRHKSRPQPQLIATSYDPQSQKHRLVCDPG